MASKRYCRYCGFRIEKRQVRTGREFTPPFWREAWVHTLYEQIADLKARAMVGGSR